MINYYGDIKLVLFSNLFYLIYFSTKVLLGKYTSTQPPNNHGICQAQASTVSASVCDKDVAVY